MYEWTYPSSYEDRFRRLSDELLCDELTRLRDDGGDEDILAVATAIFARAGRVRDEAEETLDALLARACPVWIASRADRELRGISDLRRTSSRAHPNVWLAEDTLAWSTAAILTCSGSGHIRQRALDRLRTCDGGGELPFLLARANDWVPQVAEVARALLEARLHPDQAVHWVRQLALLTRLEAVGRFDVRPLTERVRALVLGSTRDALLSAVQSPSRHERRAAARLLADAEPSDDELAVLLRSCDTMVRRITANTLLAGDDVARVRDVALHLVDDRFAPLAAKALDALSRVAPEVADAQLRTALLSRRTAPRHVAQTRLRAASVDVEALYAEVLLGDDVPERELATALMGFAETTQGQDVDAVRTFADHSSPCVRRAVVRALARLAPDDVDAFIAAIADPGSGVSRAGSDALVRRAAVIPFDVLARLATADNPVRVRTAALRLLARHDVTRSAPLLVAAAADLDYPGMERARNHLKRWLRAVAPPAPALPEHARCAALAAFRESAAHLPDELTARALRLLAP